MIHNIAIYFVSFSNYKNLLFSFEFMYKYWIFYTILLLSNNITCPNDFFYQKWLKLLFLCTNSITSHHGLLYKIFKNVQHTIFSKGCNSLLLTTYYFNIFELFYLLYYRSFETFTSQLSTITRSDFQNVRVCWVNS